MTCSGAITSSIIALIPGNYGSTVGITDFTGAMHEIGTYPTSLIVTTTTATARNADAVSATVPAVPSKWCIAVTAKPLHAWNTDTEFLWSLGLGTGGSPNTAAMTQTIFTVTDAAPVQKYVAYTAPAAASPRMVACSTSGTLNVWADTVLKTGSITGAGSGVMTAPATTLYLGAPAGAANYIWAGYLKSIRICKASKAKECP